MKYADADAFRVALEHRLRTRAQQRNVDISRLRKQVVFDRLLARLLTVAPERYVLKGGYALDLRLGDRARSTQDIDLAIAGSLDAVIDDLAAVDALGMDDYFSFTVTRTTALDNLDAATAARFRVQARLAGRRFEQFNLDIGFGSDERQAYDLVEGQDLVSFAGLTPLLIPTVVIERHVAEKIHAYTRVYADDRQSTRVKDLVDLVLVSEEVSIVAGPLTLAIQLVFAARAGHPMPTYLTQPPSTWTARYPPLAKEVGIAPDVQMGWGVASIFLNPVLGGEVAPEAAWSPGDRRWVVR